MRRKAVLAVLLTVCAVVSAQDFRITRDDTCQGESPVAGIHYSVVSPAGCATVEMIRQAPRLSTLSGKRIAVTGVSGYRAGQQTDGYMQCRNSCIISSRC